mgnify:CR=1 FL=1
MASRNRPTCRLCVHKFEHGAIKRREKRLATVRFRGAYLCEPCAKEIAQELERRSGQAAIRG